MSACHGEDQRIAIHSDDIPRARQALRLRRLVSLFIKAFFTRTNDSEHLSRGDVDLANGMVFGVANIHEVLVLAEHMAETLGVMKLRLVVISID